MAFLPKVFFSQSEHLSNGVIYQVPPKKNFLIIFFFFENFFFFELENFFEGLFGRLLFLIGQKNGVTFSEKKKFISDTKNN